MNITTGKIAGAQKVLVYGPEGIGKSTFAAQFPDPLFIDTEGSTRHMDVKRLDRPTSWGILLQQVAWVKANRGVCQTLVIDTADWAEQLCIAHICSKAQVGGIEDFGYGKGFTYLAEEFGRLLNMLTEVIDAGIHVVLTAHAQIRKFEQPDEMAAYDRWELKLQKKTAPLVKEWADAVLFANYKTYAVTDSKTKKTTAQGGQRVMYTSHRPAWDAKNRHELADELPFEFAAIAEAIAFEPVLRNQAGAPISAHEEVPVAAPVATPAASDAAPTVESVAADLVGDAAPERLSDVPPHLAKLYDLIRGSKVTISDVQEAVAFKGYYPKGTPVEKYDAGFVEGALVAAWPSVLGIIADIKKIPF